MAVKLTLDATSHSITATLSGMDTAYEYDRKFVWFLDGAQYREETVAPGSDSHSFTFSPVYFASDHTVALEIYSTVSGNLLADPSGSVSTTYADIPFWTWDGSNGTASAAQTIQAYEAATEHGKVSAFNHRVWNDLAALIGTALEAVGLSWSGSSAQLDGGDPLTAQKFNAVVSNIRYPYWTWQSLPGSYGYLGRTAMRKGDTVYGQYLVELAKYLNVVISIYNGTASTRETGVSGSFQLSLNRANAISRHSAPAAYSGGLYLAHSGPLLARHSAPMAYDRALVLSHQTPLVSLHSARLRVNRALVLEEVMNLIATGRADMEYMATLTLAEQLGLAVTNALTPLLLDDGCGITEAMTATQSPSLHLPGGTAASAFLTAARLMSLGACRLETDTQVTARITAAMRRRVGADMESQTAASVLIAGELVRYLAAGADSSVLVTAAVESGMNRAMGSSAGSDVTVQLKDQGRLLTGQGVSTGGAVPVTVRIASSAVRVRGASAAGSVTVSSSVESAASSALASSISGNIKTEVTAAGDGKSCRPISAAAESQVRQTSGGVLVQSKPLFAAGAAEDAAVGTGTAVLRPDVKLTGQAGHVVDFTAALKRQKAVELYGRVGLSAATHALLELEGDESGWKAPARNGDELTVYQVHLVGQHHGIIRIDWVRYTELCGAGDLTLEQTAAPFVSGGWDFPAQYKRILTVSQSVAVAAKDNEIEVS